MNILEEFWYGSIEPAEYDASSSKEYKELLQLISRNEDKLLAPMTDAQKELFTKYVNVSGNIRLWLSAQPLPSGRQNEAGSDERATDE